MLASPVVLSTALITILILIAYLTTTIIVSRMRSKHHIAAPATIGHPEFERAFRVQMNTLEHLPVVLPLMWLTAIFFSPFPLAAPLLGVVWIIGRALYMDGYMKAAQKRGPGFGLCGVAEILLLILALIGVIMTWAAVA